MKIILDVSRPASQLETERRSQYSITRSESTMAVDKA
jgi:hypothetical protein